MFRTVSRSVARQSRSSRVTSRTPQLLRPLSTTAYRMSNSTLKSVDPPVSTALPGDSFQLLPEASKAGQAEDALFEEQVQAVKDWWASPRYKGIKRPYSAEDVVSKRGALQQSYPSSLMARKLFNLLEERAAKGEPVHTSAFILVCIDSIMADHMFSISSGRN
jgi:isocitrate lyase